MKTLLVKSTYVNRDMRFHPGTIEVDDELAAFLMRDAPGVFAEPKAPAEESTKAFDAPPVDKMVRKAKTK